jgi:HEPN domain-containing protein
MKKKFLFMEHETYEIWLHYARADLALACKDIGPDDIKTLFAFHAQQCAEKALKAILIANSKEPPRTHDLAFLIHLVSEFEPVPTECFIAAELTVFAVSARYPDYEEDISLDELNTAIETSRIVLDWAMHVISGL